MKILCRILSICFLVLSCNSDNAAVQSKNFCSADDPIEDLDWLRAEVAERTENMDASSKYYYISQAITREGTVFIYGNCDPVANTVLPVFNCSGENIGFIGDGNFTDEALTSAKIIWKPEDFACQF